jgi:Flp pilus assembly protein TadD
MAFWNKLFGGGDRQRVDYYNEGVELLTDGKFHEALTSFRLALKEAPSDPIVLQQIAICYTRIGMTDEAAKTYRHVLQKDSAAAGAHYGLAFILLHVDEPEGAIQHLEAFLEHAPKTPEAGDHVTHARATLARLRGEAHDAPMEPPPPNELF